MSRRRLTVLALALVAVVTGAPAAAATPPSLTASPGTVSPGERYELVGRSWSQAIGCEPRVQLSRRLGHGLPVGRADVGRNGAFRFRLRAPRRARPGARIVLDATQYCRASPDGGRVGTTRTVVIRVVARWRTCPLPLSVSGAAYLVRVRGLACEPGAQAIGEFLDTGVDPAAFDCADLDPRTGADAVCQREDRRWREIRVRRVSEV